MILISAGYSRIRALLYRSDTGEMEAEDLIRVTPAVAET